MKKILVIALLIVVFVALSARALLHYKGLQVTSWYRTPWKNYEVGGQWFSLHMIGWAFDVVPVNQTIHDVLRIWPFKWVVESDHIHMQIL